MLFSKKWMYAKFIASAMVAYSYSFTTTSFAQENNATQSDPPAQQQQAWTKICSQDPNTQKNMCITIQQLRGKTDRFLASVAIQETEGEDKKSLVIAVPPGMLLQPGMRLQIDQNDPQVVKYTICFPNACYAEIKVDDSFVDQLKRGNQIAITIVNQQAKALKLPITLIGFTKSYEGAPIDPKQLQAQQQKLREELERKAEEARQRLIQQQQEATSGSN